MFIAVLQEAAQGPISLFLGYTCDCTVFGCQSSGHFGHGDFSDQYCILGGGIGELRDPIAASLSTVAFD